MFFLRGVVFVRSVAVTAVCVAAAFLFACGGPAERIKERANATPEVTPTPGERPISGSLQVDGTSAGGQDPYHGALEIVPLGDVYSFKWSVTKGSRTGTGVQNGNNAAVSFASSGAGKGCGVVLYKVLTGGNLDGRTVGWGDEKFGMEKAEKVDGTNFPGKYKVTGTTADGKPYSGSMEIQKDGEGYDVQWKTDKALVGFAIWRGSVAAVSFGGPQCGFALYDISSNGSLDGFWGGQKEITFGKESAKRQ